MSNTLSLLVVMVAVTLAIYTNCYTYFTFYGFCFLLSVRGYYWDKGVQYYWAEKSAERNLELTRLYNERL